LLAGVAALTNMGPIDLTVSGRYLYAQTGIAGTIDGFRINGDGSLTSIGSVTGLPVGQEGIASN
jgi:6-phosphogluconolactonase (cycloisomerase 2 family)